jgi:protease-4
VRALVVRIDSPGGGVAATQEMVEGLRRFRQRTGHPVVASLGAMAASGGYYLCCAAQKIVCEPGTLTGSIGVILSFTDASELLRKLGVRVEVVKSGDRKDFGGFWRGLTEDERSMLQEVVADAHAQFTAAVGEARGLSPEQVRTVADGRIFTGRQALAAGLVDTLGFESEAVALAARLSGMSPETPTLSRARRSSGWLDLMRRLTEEARTPGLRGPRLEYR